MLGRKDIVGDPRSTVVLQDQPTLEYLALEQRRDVGIFGCRSKVLRLDFPSLRELSVRDMEVLETCELACPVLAKVTIKACPNLDVWLMISTLQSPEMCDCTVRVIDGGVISIVCPCM